MVCNFYGSCRSVFCNQSFYKAMNLLTEMIIDIASRGVKISFRESGDGKTIRTIIIRVEKIDKSAAQKEISIDEFRDENHLISHFDNLEKILNDTF